MRTRKAVIFTLVLVAHLILAVVWNTVVFGPEPLAQKATATKAAGGEPDRARTDAPKPPPGRNEPKAKTKTRLSVRDARADEPMPQGESPKPTPPPAPPRTRETPPEPKKEVVPEVKKETTQVASTQTPVTKPELAKPEVVKPEPKPAAPTPKVTDAKTLAAYREQTAEEYGFKKGEPVSALLVSSSDATTHRRALEAFGFKWVARVSPKSSGHKPLYVIQNGRGLIRHDGKCPYAGWSMADLPDNEVLRQEAVRVSGLPETSLEFFYASTNADAESYLRGKQRKAIQDLGLRPEEVREVLGRMTETSFGGFVFIIEQLLTRDGQILAYDDPDTREVSLKS